MVDPCDVCGAAATMTPLVEAGLPGVGPIWIHRCADCGARQVRPRLPPAALDALYGADYFGSDSGHGFSGYARQRQRYDRDAFFLARDLRRLAPAGRFLEVGSALGFLLASLAPITRWEVEGVEVSAFAAWYARDRFGARVHQGTLEAANLPPEAFDYVLQKDLLEHVTHPRRHLQETRRIMRQGARLRVITPNGEADVRPLQRAAAGLTPGDVPVLDQGHLSFFSRAQLLRLFDDVGFRVLSVWSVGIRRGLRALGVIPGRRSRVSCDAARGTDGSHDSGRGRRGRARTATSRGAGRADRRRDRRASPAGAGLAAVLPLPPPREAAGRPAGLAGGRAGLRPPGREALSRGVSGDRVETRQGSPAAANMTE